MGKFYRKSPSVVAAIVAILIAVALVGGCTSAGKSGGKNEDKNAGVAATVNGEKVYFQDVNELYAYQAPEQQVSLSKSDALSLVIEREILHQEAAKQGFAATGEEVEQEYKNFLTLSNKTEPALEGDLAAKNSSVERFKSALGKRIAINKLLDSHVDASFKIKHDEVEALYNASDFRSLNISFDDAEGSIVNFLTAQHRKAQRDSYVANLKEIANVTIIAVPN